MEEPKTRSLRPAKPVSIEQRYTKMTQLEHVLARPDSYVGSCNPESTSLWVWSAAKQHMEYKLTTYVPAMYKIFDEIIVNAADVKSRETFEGGEKRRAQKITCIKVTVDSEQGCISVFNNGAAIPIEVHKTYNVYVPEMIFGQLLTSDNYDDSQQRFTGGRNGYGAKLTNIFSKRFEIECVDSKRRKTFHMAWKNNMTQKSEPQIASTDALMDYVKVTFWPDFKRLNMPDGLRGDIFALLEKRVYDLAGTTGLAVSFNGRELDVHSFLDYVDLYFRASDPLRQLEMDGAGASGGATSSAVEPSAQRETLKIFEKISQNWEVCVAMSDGQFRHVSFVNNICTSKGGTHVAYVVEPIVQSLLKKINSMNKGGMQVKAHQVKNHLFVFLNCKIVNPTFDSQTKEFMSLNSSAIYPTASVSDKTITAILKSPILQTIMDWLQLKQQSELKRLLKGTGRTGRERIVGIPKLDDANDAGTSNGHHCTLILTEGDSAKTSCIAGLSVVGRDRYGVFPLRGKVLNVRDATFKQLSENKEIQYIMKITGLEIGKDVPDARSLRYGSIMIMTDQDHDGSHIKGLIINLLQHFWPSLLKYPGFLKQFVTPIIKAFAKNEVRSFFTLQEFDDWRSTLPPAQLLRYKFKYYKGLGTSGAKEFQEYFSNMEQHQLAFKYVDGEDFEAIDMAFNSKRAHDRKEWIQSFVEGTFLDHNVKEVRYKDFINKELVLFSRYDVQRSIPNMVDGLKPAQRKVLYGAFKKNLVRSEMKVAQFASYVADVSSYHHGEESIAQTVVNMAQQFVGTNNLNLLEPCGQFGSRKEGGRDASATRYIFTKLSNVCRFMFRQEDEPLLDYQNDDNVPIEPKFYVPVIPQLLVNGAEGIGTGWSCSIPNYNPHDIIENIRRYLAEKPLQPMVPWYRDFKGKIEPNQKGGFDSVGVIEEIDQDSFRISELPVRVWTQPYKVYLEEELQLSIEQTSKKKDKKPTASKSSLQLLDYKDNSSHENVDFECLVASENVAALYSAGLDRAFKLRKSISLSNLVAFNVDCKIYRYKDELEMLKDFCAVRLMYYERRKAYMVRATKKELSFLTNKTRFVLAILDDSLVEITHLNHQLQVDSAEAEDNEQKISKNTQLPHLISNVAEIIENEQPTEDESALKNSDDLHSAKSVIIRTSQRHQVFLRHVGLVAVDELRPNDRVAVNRDSFLILSKLPTEFDPRAKAMEVTELPTDSYADIGGLDKQVQELVESIVLPLLRPELFEALGVRSPKGLLLYGPPGTGKTLLARACAAECKATFLKLAGTELVQMYIGDGARIVRDAFELAKQKAPAIIFIDEIDSIGVKRSSDGSLADREVERTMLELLSQLDGFVSNDRVKLIAATNRPDILDPALTRSGRLDRKIEFALPDEAARVKIFQIHSRKMAVDKSSVVFEELARLTDGLNASQIRACCIEAGMCALRSHSKSINHVHFVKGVEEVEQKKKDSLNYFS
uniref:DNA topoisomerase 2 n=1 Tax=Dermatophagoides pteronyssinus TaxID=6956 RepID=A0A6P6Y5X4_DERPT|nr:DNA topoisomerase 2-like [Dermatophagoides pteronyssinus]